MQFEGMKIGNIVSDGETAKIQIDDAIIIKNMDDAEQDTKWHGKGTLTISELVIDSEDFPGFPTTVTTADIKDNQITYRNEANIPIKFHGNVGISLQFEGFDKTVKFSGERMSFEVSGHEKYIEHLTS